MLTGLQDSMFLKLVLFDSLTHVLRYKSSGILQCRQVDGYRSYEAADFLHLPGSSSPRGMFNLDDRGNTLSLNVGSNFPVGST